MSQLVVVVFQVEDLSKWEEGFRTRAELFRSRPVVSPYRYAMNAETNEVAVSGEVTDFDVFMQELESPQNAEAMVADGIKMDTVKLFVLDKEFHF